METKQLTQEQKDRLDTFKAAYGAGWKTVLNTMWMNGSDARQVDGHLLRQIRNQFGPSWLMKYKG